MERLLNIENDWDGVLEGDKVEGPCELINDKEVEEAIKVMKAGKAGGPSEVVGEMLKAEHHFPRPRPGFFSPMCDSGSCCRISTRMSLGMISR